MPIKTPGKPERYNVLDERELIGIAREVARRLSRIHTIFLVGPLGAGKTTLCVKLADHYGWKASLESVEDNPYLEDFYHDMKQWAFPLQIYFLHSRFQQVSDIRNSSIPMIQDRTIYEDAYIFAKNLKDSFCLSPRDYDTYLRLFHSMVNMLEAPDLLLYLLASISKLVEQITRRGRPYESFISIKYLENLNRNYEEWISRYSEGNLLVIEADNLDYVNNPDDFQHVLKLIENEYRAIAQ